MKFYKIMALIYADMMLLRNSKWRFVEYVYFPVTTIIIWGLFSVYARSFAAEAGVVVLVVNVLWNFGQLAQQHVNMQINEDSWSGSIKQIFVSGVSDMEYITARIISSIITSLLILALLAAISVFAFNTVVFVTQWEIFSLLVLATLIASVGLAVMVAGMMVALGREYGFLAWTALQAFVLLSAPFYPASVYPEILRPIVAVMPFTATFEATRAAVAGTVTQGMIINCFTVSAAYLAVSFPFYKYIFKKALERGWITRLG